MNQQATNSYRSLPLKTFYQAYELSCRLINSTVGSALLVAFASTTFLLCFPSIVDPLSFDHVSYFDFADSKNKIPDKILRNLAHQEIRYPIIALFKLVHLSPPTPHSIEYLLIGLTSIQCTLVFLLTQLLTRGRYRILGITAAAITCCFPHLSSRSSAVVDLLSANLILLSLICLHFFYCKKSVFYFGSLAFFLLAYASRVSNLFFFPAFLVSIYLYEKRAAKWFLALTLIYIGLETLACYYYWDLHYGRLQILLSSYGNNRIWKTLTTKSILGLLHRYELGNHKNALLAFSIFGSLYSLWILRLKDSLFGKKINFSADKDPQDAALISTPITIILAHLSYIFVLTFAFTSYRPFSPILPYDERYLLPAIPLMAISTVFLFYLLTSEHGSPAPANKENQNGNEFNKILICACLLSFLCSIPNNTYAQIPSINKLVARVFNSSAKKKARRHYRRKRVETQQKRLTRAIKSGNTLLTRNIYLYRRSSFLLKTSKVQAQLKVGKCRQRYRYYLTARNDWTGTNSEICKQIAQGLRTGTRTKSKTKLSKFFAIKPDKSVGLNKLRYRHYYLRKISSIRPKKVNKHRRKKRSARRRLKHHKKRTSNKR